MVTCKFIILSLFASLCLLLFPRQSACFVDQPLCETEASCDAFLTKDPPVSGLGVSYSGDVIDEAGHGQCVCAGLHCIEETPCAQSLSITVDAGNNWLCDWMGTSLGHTEVFFLNVSYCGDDDYAQAWVSVESDCRKPFMSVYLYLFCGGCGELLGC